MLLPKDALVVCVIGIVGADDVGICVFLSLLKVHKADKFIEVPTNLQSQTQLCLLLLTSLLLFTWE